MAVFQVFEETVDLVLLFEVVEAVFEGFGLQEMVGEVGGFAGLDAGAETVESGGGGGGGRDSVALAEGEVGFGDGAGATVAGDEELGGGAGLLQLLLETGVGVAEGFGFGGLIVELLGEAGGELLVAEAALECGAGEGLVLLFDGELGFAAPLLDGVLVLLELAVEEMLVGDGDGDLGFDLEELVLHVEDELLGELFGVFGFVDQVVDVGSEESAYAFEEGHGKTSQLLVASC